MLSEQQKKVAKHPLQISAIVVLLISSNILSSTNPIALSPFHRCLCGHIMLGLPSTPSNSPFVLTESLHPKSRILLYHYHLYALTGTCLCAFRWQHENTPLILQQKHSKCLVLVQEGTVGSQEQHYNRR